MDQFLLSGLLIQQDSRKFELPTYVDTGCSTYALMDPETVTSLKISTNKLSYPIPVQLANGHYSTLITHQTIPLTLQLGDHFEKISFLITSIPHPILLGLPWLRFHAPNTDWKNLIFTFQQNCISWHHCQQECSIQAKNTNLSSIKSNPTLNTRIESTPIQNTNFSSTFSTPTLNTCIESTPIQNTNLSSTLSTPTLNTRIESTPIQNQTNSTADKKKLKIHVNTISA